MATTTGNEAYEVRARLTQQASQEKPRDAHERRGRGIEGRGEGGETGNRARPGPPPAPLTPPKSPDGDGSNQENEFRKRTIETLGESLKATARTVLKLRQEEFSPATCTLVQDAFRRVPEYIQMLEEHGGREEARA